MLVLHHLFCARVGVDRHSFCLLILSLANDPIVHDLSLPCSLEVS